MKSNRNASQFTHWNFLLECESESYARLQRTDHLADKCQLVINKTVKYTKAKGYHIGKPKTKRSVRTIDIPPYVSELLEVHLETHEFPYIFNDFTDRFIIPCTMRYRFKSDLSLCELPEIHFHDIRHTVATTLLREGRPVVAVASLLGDKPETVNAVYSHAIPEMKADVVDTISTKFFA